MSEPPPPPPPPPLDPPSFTAPPGIRQGVARYAPAANSSANNRSTSAGSSSGMSETERRLRAQLAALGGDDIDDSDMDILAGYAPKPAPAKSSVASSSSSPSAVLVDGSSVDFKTAAQLLGVNDDEMLAAINNLPLPNKLSTAATAVTPPLYDDRAMINQYRQGGESFDAAAIMRRAMLSFHTSNKQLLYTMCSPGPDSKYPHAGRMDVTRWKEIPFPTHYPLPAVDAAEGINLIPYLASIPTLGDLESTIRMYIIEYVGLSTAHVTEDIMAQNVFTYDNSHRVNNYIDMHHSYPSSSSNTGSSSSSSSSSSSEKKQRLDSGDNKSKEKQLAVWHLNFAHSQLFVAWNSPLFAQDEMQVCEHPSLAALREALLKSTVIYPSTAVNGHPTPILIRGAQRRCSVETGVNASQDRPYGLYGNQFARASLKAVRLATTVLVPPTISNIIAIEAPPGGRGFYRMSDINGVLSTAYSAFVAVRIDSHDLVNDRQPFGSKPIVIGAAPTPTPAKKKKTDDDDEDLDDSLTFTTDADGNLVANVKGSNQPSPAVVPSSAPVPPVNSIMPHVEIHTGNWGTGAYGGNRVLMACLQLLAARLSRVDTFVFHTVDLINSKAYQQAARLLDYLVPSPLVTFIMRMARYLHKGMTVGDDILIMTVIHRILTAPTKPDHRVITTEQLKHFMGSGARQLLQGIGYQWDTTTHTLVYPMTASLIPLRVVALHLEAAVQLALNSSKDVSGVDQPLIESLIPVADRPSFTVWPKSATLDHDGVQLPVSYRIATPVPVATILNALFKQNFKWGVSDGN